MVTSVSLILVEIFLSLRDWQISSSLYPRISQSGTLVYVFSSSLYMLLNTDRKIYNYGHMGLYIAWLSKESVEGWITWNTQQMSTIEGNQKWKSVINVQIKSTNKGFDLMIETTKKLSRKIFFPN